MTVVLRTQDDQEVSSVLAVDSLCMELKQGRSPLYLEEMERENHHAVHAPRLAQTHFRENRALDRIL